MSSMRVDQASRDQVYLPLSAILVVDLVPGEQLYLLQSTGVDNGLGLGLSPCSEP